MTFDDGYADAFTHAFPILQQHSLVGTFFIVRDFMERPGYLTWQQAQTMLDAGMEIENHSASHPDLRGRDRAFLLDQIGGTAEAIEANLGKRSRFFCYPSGQYDQNTLQVVKETGHRLAVTTQDGTLHTSSNPFRLTRARVRGTTGVTGLDWLISRSV
jgi:peptidoglycan/xylan/chitin deacetylase (PgdA/CDA1 family)